MMEGVSGEKMGSGHGVGKGRGFYIIPAKNEIKSLDKAESSAKGWDPHTVAVFLPENCVRIVAQEGETVQTLEQKHKGQKCYYEFGSEEAVIPPSLFPEILLVRDPADISVANPSYPAVPAKGSSLGFLKTLPK